jgi:enamine deaminase RidA (YjgF/YER057c/UK114 family)
MTMTIERLNPDGLHATPGYHHVTIVPTGRIAYLAGQCPLDPQGDLVGAGDPAAQVDQVVANSTRALEAVGATPSDVVRTTIYVVPDGDTPLGAVWRRFLASPLAPAFTSASTLVGVVQLGFTGQLVELDMTAALTETSSTSATLDE